MIPDCLIQNICMGSLPLNHIPADFLPEVIKKIHTGEIKPIICSESISRISLYIEKNGITDELSVLIENIIKAEDNLEKELSMCAITPTSLKI